MVKILSVKTLKPKLRKQFNLFIRLRDLKKGCISCGRRYAEICGAWQAGHWYPSSICSPSLDFHEMNLHGQCAYCNLNEGNRQGYREGLIKRYGMDWFNKLEILRATSRGSVWGVWEYQAMLVQYKAKVSELSLRL